MIIEQIPTVWQKNHTKIVISRFCFRCYRMVNYVVLATKAMYKNIEIYISKNIKLVPGTKTIEHFLRTIRFGLLKDKYWLNVTFQEFPQHDNHCWWEESPVDSGFSRIERTEYWWTRVSRWIILLFLLNLSEKIGYVSLAYKESINPHYRDPAQSKCRNN